MDGSGLAKHDFPQLVYLIFHFNVVFLVHHCIFFFFFSFLESTAFLLANYKVNTQKVHQPFAIFAFLVKQIKQKLIEYK